LFFFPLDEGDLATAYPWPLDMLVARFFPPPNPFSQLFLFFPSLSFWHFGSYLPYPVFHLFPDPPQASPKHLRFLGCPPVHTPPTFYSKLRSSPNNPQWVNYSNTFTKTPPFRNFGFLGFYSRPTNYTAFFPCFPPLVSYSFDHAPFFFPAPDMSALYTL